MNVNRLALVILLCGAALTVGCSSQQDNKVSEGQAPAESLEPEDPDTGVLYLGKEGETGIDYVSLAGQADRVDDLDAIGSWLGSRLSLVGMPERSRPIAFWVAKPEFNGYRHALIELSDGTLIEITVNSDVEAARAGAAIEVDPTLSRKEAHIQEMSLGSITAEAREKLDIPVVIDKDTGMALPGTGLKTGVAKISWAQDRFSIMVMSETAAVAQLLPIARAVRLDAE
ncbi:MAG: hypothetical protein KGZ40_05950 [Clostridiales bacterium]|nr:hypothetical protein [Clostridiales bacterium]